MDKNLRLYFVLTPLLAAFILFEFTMCKENSSSPVNQYSVGQLISYTDCKSFDVNIMMDNHPSNEECIEYEYNGSGILQLKHVNAGFNCCPGELNAVISVEGNVITISESEEEARCRCNCLYDLEYNIRDLNPGIYTIKIISPYSDNIIFNADFSSEAGNSYCEPRNEYPWGL